MAIKIEEVTKVTLVDFDGDEFTIDREASLIKIRDDYENTLISIKAEDIDDLIEALRKLSPQKTTPADYVFKAGDRVVCVKEPDDTSAKEPLFGKRGSVVRVEHHGIQVSWRDWNGGWSDISAGDTDECNWWVDSEELALVA